MHACPGWGLYTNSCLPWCSGDPEIQQDKARRTVGLSRRFLNNMDIQSPTLKEDTPIHCWLGFLSLLQNCQHGGMLSDSGPRQEVTTAYGSQTLHRLCVRCRTFAPSGLQGVCCLIPTPQVARVFREVKGTVCTAERGC